MEMNQALRVIDQLTLDRGFKGFVETMEYIDEFYNIMDVDTRVAFDTIKGGLARIFAAQEAA